MCLEPKAGTALDKRHELVRVIEIIVVADNAGTMVDDPRRLVALKAIEEMPDAALLSESADYACLKLKAPDLLAAVELIRLHSLSQKQKAGSFYPSGLRISGGRYKI